MIFSPPPQKWSQNPTWKPEFAFLTLLVQKHQGAARQGSTLCCFLICTRHIFKSYKPQSGSQYQRYDDILLIYFWMFLLLQTQNTIKNVYVIHRRGREQKRKEQEVEADAAVPTHKFVRGASTNHRWANAALSLRAAPLSHLTWTPLKHIVSMAPFEYPLSHHRWYLKLDMIRLAQKNIELRNRGDKGTITMENSLWSCKTQEII